MFFNDNNLPKFINNNSSKVSLSIRTNNNMAYKHRIRCIQLWPRQRGLGWGRTTKQIYTFQLQCSSLNLHGRILLLGFQGSRHQQHKYRPYQARLQFVFLFCHTVLLHHHMHLYGTCPRNSLQFEFNFAITCYNWYQSCVFWTLRNIIFITF